MEFVIMPMKPGLNNSICAGLMLALVQPVFADSVVTSESKSAMLVYQLVRDYQLVNGTLPDSWQVMASWNPFLNEPEGFIAVGLGISDSYSFVPSAEGNKFPLGRLLLITGFPIPAPNPASVKDVDMATMTEAARQMLVTRRYIIYVDETGKLAADWWHENRIQKVLQETGITIPRPTPYYPKAPDGEYLPLTPQAIEALVRLDLTDTIPPELLAKMQTTGTLPSALANRPRTGNATAPGASSPATAPTTLAQIVTSPWAAWALAALALIAAVLYFRRHRAKRG